MIKDIVRDLRKFKENCEENPAFIGISLHSVEQIARTLERLDKAETSQEKGDMEFELEILKKDFFEKSYFSREVKNRVKKILGD